MKNFSFTAAKPNCIQLHRFVRLGDKHDSQVFTFIVPSQLTRGFINVAQSKYFAYGGQSWQLQLCLQQDDASKFDDTAVAEAADVSVSKKPTLSVGLTLCGALAGMNCQLELIRYTVLNRDSVHLNKTYEERHVSFTADEPTRKKAGWLSADRLTPEHFLFDDWTWLLEVELKGANTLYEEYLTLPKSGLKCTPGRSALRLDSASFTYAGSDWSITLNWPVMNQKKHSITSLVRSCKSDSGNTCCPQLKLQRHSRTDHWCRVRYKATLVWGNIGESSFGPVDHLITADNGATTAGSEIGDSKWFTQAALSAKQRVKIIIEMLAAAPISRIDLVPIAPQGGKNFSRCKDTDGREWVVLSDILGTLVRLRFFPVVEVHQHETAGLGHVKDGVSFTDRPCELQCVAWNVHLIPHETTKSVVRALHSPYVSYVPTYRCHVSRDGGGADIQPSVDFSNDSQKMMIHSDEVTEVALDLPVEKVIDKNSGYIRPNDNTMTIRIEWLQSQRLYNGSYNVYDDLFQTQKAQLARELRTLQLENYALEKQLYMGNAPNSVEINVLEHTDGATRHPRPFSQQSEPINNSRLPTDTNIPHTSRESTGSAKNLSFSQVRRLPDTNCFSSQTQDTFLSTNTIQCTNIRRHSSSFLSAIETQGRPRRSLPSPATVGAPNWQRHSARVVDDEYSEGYNGREDSLTQSSLQVGVNGLQVRSNMSSPIRSNYRNHLRPHALRGGAERIGSGGALTPSPSNQAHRNHRSVTPTLVFSLSSEDSISGGGDGGRGGSGGL